MMPGQHRLLAQLGAGPDGVAYRGHAPDGATAVEVRVLGRAWEDDDRRPALVRRLRRAALLRHPAAVAVREFDLEEAPPYLALEWVEGDSLAERLGGRLPLPAGEALELVRALAELLAEAHRLGLAHGGLRPESVRLTGGAGLKVDFTGTRVGGPGDAPTGPPTPEGDGAALGALLAWLLTGRPAAEFAPGAALPEGLPGLAAELLRGLLAPEPADRPSAAAVADRLRALLLSSQATRCGDSPAAADGGPPAAAAAPERLGRFRLLGQLGQGGMGAVYRAEDASDGSIVAIKVLRGASASQPAALRRFHKEARLLAELSTPYVTGLLEVNEDGGTHYLVLEYVEGGNLDQVIGRRGRLPEREALELIADVARGLAEAHAAGVVHRDVKPENVLLPAGGGEVRAKLSDFGLARHVVETESLNLTRAGAVLGTPLYMSPEQCAGAALDARSDVYSLGATLYHALAGRPPFGADSLLALVGMHARQAPPSLAKLDPPVSEGACRVVEKALAKSPADRYADAAAFLRDLERLLRGEPAGPAAHPRRPDADPARVLRYDFAWDLEAPPAALWPHVSNTERLNRAAGLGPVRFTERVEGEGGGGRRVRRRGEFRKAGLAVSWEEHPFEWVEARRLGVLREYVQGPFRWLTSVVELAPAGSGTRLTHRIEVEPHGLLGRTVAAVEIGGRARRGLERVYRRMDAALSGKAAAPHGRALLDPFEGPAEPSRAQRERLERLLDELVERGAAPEAAEGLVDFVAHAPPQEVARVRPLALARRLGLDGDAVVTACLHGARAGLLVLLWDLLCPVCRVPAGARDTLRALREHEHCPACALDFAVDFANSVELIFRAHPEVRASELATYCVGGPAHSPHVVAQARLAPGERLELELAMEEGAYRLRGPQLPYVLDFRVGHGPGAVRWEVALSRAAARPPGSLRPGGQVLALSNEYDCEVVVRVERAAARADALTAARASTLELFRELFPEETLSPGQLVSVATVTLLVTDLEGAGPLYAKLGDARAFGLLHEHFRRLRDRVRAEGGALVKTVGEGAVAAFTDPAAAVRTALALPDLLPPGGNGLRPRAGVHRGAALAATVNEHLDYFGAAVRQALALPGLARGGELVLTEAAAGDPQVAALLRERGLRGELFEAALPDGACLAQRLALPGAAGAP